MIYVIEHMDKELYEWCIIEYRRISKLVGKENLMIFNLKDDEIEKLKGIAKCYKESVNFSKEIDSDKSCVLDPNTTEILTSKDNFEYYVFGGILGDDPPTGKTSEIILENADRKHIGDKQMSTDNAVLCTKLITEGTEFKDIEFKDDLEIEIDEGESIILPFRYIMIDGKPNISKEIIEILKKDGF